MIYRHIPVLLEEVIRSLQPMPGGHFIDCTLGGGGYTQEIARLVGYNGKVLSIDLDPMAIENAKAKFKSAGLDNIVISNDNFRNLSQIISREFEREPDIRFDGIVFDLGLSSAQLEDRNRGFSFQDPTAPLKMGFGASTAGKSAQDIVNEWKEEDLAKIIYEYGEERFARSIAKGIIKRRSSDPIKNVGELVEAIGGSVPAAYRNDRRIHFATRTFQALRIAENRELESLELVLPQAVRLLKSGGRIAVVTFHSLEDRIVKHYFKSESMGCICPPKMPVCGCGHQASLKILTKKAVGPTADEIKNNPRSRSAKLRAAEKI